MSIYTRPIELLQTLIRFDTTNPPGNELACIQYIDGLLQEAGIATTLLAKDPNRPNLVARLPGRGDAPALVLQGHVDVVTTVGQPWSRDPFAAEVVDGFVWGRGALDMKGSVTMMLASVLRAHAEGMVPAGDIILTIMADEENGSDFGARFLVEEHPEQFAGARYAIGEGGGQTEHIGGNRYYAIMVAEKGVCWMRAKVTGPGGHGASPMRGGAMARLGQMLTALDGNRLPVHITPVMERMLRTLADTTPAELAGPLAALLDPAQTDAVLDQLHAAGLRQARSLDALLHNTVNTTVVRGGFKTNVVPREIDLELDGRLLPGFTPDDMLRELHAIIGDEIEVEVMRHDSGLLEPDFGLFPLFEEVLAEVDPGAIALPTMVPGFTDGRMFGQLGIQNYGFTPLRMPPDFDFFPTVHNADERIPVDALEFGCATLYRVLERYR